MRLSILAAFAPLGFAVTACGGTTTNNPPIVHVVTPEVRASTEHPEEHQTLTPTRIRAEVGAHASEIQTCYNGALARNPAHRGEVLVFFEIAPDGHVLRSNIVSNTSGDPEAGTCLLGVVTAIHFSPTGLGIVETRYSFDFREIDRDGDGVP